MPKKVLPKYVFIAPNKSDPTMGAGFVLQTVKPFCIGRIIKIKPEEYFFEKYLIDHEPVAAAEVPGHSIIVTYAGNIEGYRLFIQSKNWEEDLKRTFEAMARWYLQEKVMNNLGYYKRYKTL